MWHLPCHYYYVGVVVWNKAVYDAVLCALCNVIIFIGNLSKYRYTSNHPLSARTLNPWMFMFIFCNKSNITWYHPHICGWCVILAHALNNGIQQLVTSAFSAKKNHRNQVAVMLKTKLAQKDHPHTWNNFLATCAGLFQMQHLLHYGAMLAEKNKERKKERKKES